MGSWFESAWSDIERGCPWFLSAVVKEIGMVVNLGFLLVGVTLTAYRGGRGVFVPSLNIWAARLVNERLEYLGRAMSTA